MTKENMTASNLVQFYKPLASSLDDNGLEFVATIEAVNYPFWGVQFHPEKNVYEWGVKYTSVPHAPSAVKAGLYFAEFIVNEGICNFRLKNVKFNCLYLCNYKARKNQHRFGSQQEEESYLIYNYAPVYTGNVSSSFIQSYFFN